MPGTVESPLPRGRPYWRRVGVILLGSPLALAALVATSSPASAASITGDWVEPLSSAQVVSTWHESGCASNDPHSAPDGAAYSTGIDLAGATGTPVSSLAAGVVVAEPSGIAWGAAAGPTGTGLMIGYTASDGTPFTALYGDVRVTSGIVVGDAVDAGQQIATLDSGALLHLAIHPGAAAPGDALAAGQCPVGSDDGGFVDPSAFLAEHTPPLGTIADGVFVSHDGEVYRVAGGAPLPIRSWDAFGGARPATALTDAQWSELAPVPADGTFIRGVRRGEIYRVAGGAPIYVSTWDAFGGARPTVDVDDAAIDHAGQTGIWSHLRTVPADGTLVRGSASGTVSVIASGHVTGTEGQGRTTIIDQAATTNAGTGGVWNHLMTVPVWTTAPTPVTSTLPTPPAAVSQPRLVPSPTPTTRVQVRLHGHPVGHGWLCLTRTATAPLQHHTTAVGGCVPLSSRGMAAIRPRAAGRYFLVLVGSAKHVSHRRYAFTRGTARVIRWTLA